jgi:anaerobic selenocysteine-containing dehydrogenase
MCDLCPTGCGLEVLVQDNRIIKARGDRDNGRSRGYVCRKGVSIQYHQRAQRLTHPLKRVDGSFEQISWDQALEEIATKIRAIVDRNGPGAIGYAGEPASWGGMLMGALGSQNYYSSLAQELTGEMFVHACMLGNPALGLATAPDYDETDLLLAIGWNGMASNMAPQARRYLRAFSQDPDKILVVVDPRPSETARLADFHLSIRPGTDALLTKAMISIILQEGWQDREYIAEHTNSYEAIRPWFAGFDAKAAIDVCGLDYDKVREVARLFATRRSSLKSGLGIEMNRHSTATSYLEVILKTICGRIGVQGGNVVHGALLHWNPPASEPGAAAHRTPATDYSPIMGMLPPNILPEEILSDRPDRLRALLVCAGNPLRSWAEALPIQRMNELLNPGYVEVETGYCTMPDGSGYMALLMPMPGVTADMVRWWMAWFTLDDLRYKVWSPRDHKTVSIKDEDRAMLLDPSIPRERKIQNPSPSHLGACRAIPLGQSLRR